MKTLKKVFALFFAVLLSASLFSCVAETDTQKSRPTAPDFTVLDTDGNQVKLSDFFGQPIVLNFWATWCPPCKAELPDFEKACAENDDVVFLMVNLTDGSRDTVDVVNAFISQNGYTFPVYYDTSYSAANAYGVSSIPVTYFIDRSGNVAVSHLGMISSQALADGMEKINHP